MGTFQFWPQQCHPLTGGSCCNCCECVVCHTVIIINPNTCVGCHQKWFYSHYQSHHQANQFSTNCTECHSNMGGVHPTSIITLCIRCTGAHAAIAANCVVCHTENITIHLIPVWLSTKWLQPIPIPHQANQFSTNCTDCHFQQCMESFQLDPNSVYPLRGSCGNSNELCVCHNGNYHNNQYLRRCHQTTITRTTIRITLVTSFQ